MAQTGKRTFRLQSVDGEGQAIDEISFENELAIGRAQGDLILEDPSVSRVHCLISFQEGKLKIEDLNSKNGVFVRITEPYELKLGDQFRIGRKIYRIV
ncbi:FHA domain containing protein [Leptospira ryugenii]|uniref:FHA domain containing protein n=1 Tax=Leptospira ryugenii TaxID=1917863 RepID=A0A2P2DVR0_9LEPT|nr:FHA domain-containing protein [Leptospira ryugenii]GBF48704.1 FHA domain containing protein [Leptospira ryugenii]